MVTLDPPYDLVTFTAGLARLAPIAEPEAADPTPRAAVAAILRDPGEAAGGGLEILFIQRAEREGDPWSGHLAFPGGRRAAADASLLATAVRETREEVGIDLDAHGTLIGRLPDIHAVARAKRTGMVIAPFVFSLPGHVATGTVAEHEVASVLWTPLAPLARGEGAGTLDYEVEGRTIALPCFRFGTYTLWGLTYRMVETLFEALRPQGV